MSFKEELKKILEDNIVFPEDEGFATEYAVKDIQQLFLKVVEESPKKKKCKHIAHVEPCNDYQSIAYNQAINDTIESIKRRINED